MHGQKKSKFIINVFEKMIINISAKMFWDRE